ncbi:50S ribosomal protein L13 [Candidatus Woesearchaeota archaeon]|nr:50S ribosomal protein L13 [Candidatus Woesearchaeota archaeon]
MRVINGEHMILGRAASHIAKASLLGENISLVNCDKMILTGNKQSIFARQHMLSEMKGKPTKGIFYERRPDFFVRRSIKRMLPNSARGKAALKKIRCYIATPESLKSAKQETIAYAHVQKLPNLRYMTVGELCKKMGAKWE